MKSSKRLALMTLAATLTIVGILTFMFDSRSLSAASIRSHLGMLNPLFDPQWTSLEDRSLTSDLGPHEAAQSEKAGNAKDATEAPTGFDNLTNGYLDQGPDLEELNEDTVVPLRSFNDNRFIFEEVETVEDGLGPTHNAQSCREPPKCGYRRRQSDHRTPERAPGKGQILQFHGRDFDPVTGDSPRICLHGKQNSYGALVGSADPEPPDARWPVVYAARCHPPARRPGSRRDRSVS
jgi:hypothetical protein